MPTLAFDLFWRDRGVSQGLKGLGKDADKAAEHTKRLHGIGSHLGEAFGAFVGVEVFKSFLDGARESNRIGRITEQVVRSTGGAAHVTAAQVGDLATAISNKTGADDEAIQSGENMLLTFTNVRNEAGKGNDIFNQAAQATTDLAAAMNNGQVTSDGMKTASIQLGKALNDPIKGVTALQKVGVSFTAQQRAQIKAMVDSGNTMGAQKIILAELNKEFGGTAAAAADPMQRLTVILGNLGEQIGTAVMPEVNEFADFMANTGAPAISSVVDALTKVPMPALLAAAGLIGAVKAFRTVKGVADDVRAATDLAGAGLRRVGILSTEAAAGQQVEAVASTEQAAAMDRAAAAGTRFGTALGVVTKAAAGVALYYGTTQLIGWAGAASVSQVSADKLSGSLTNLGKSGDDSFRHIFNRVGWGDLTVDTQSASESLDQFANAMQIGFGQGFLDKTTRLLSFGASASHARGQIDELDGGLAKLAGSNMGAAQDAFAKLANRLREAGYSEDEISAAFPKYYAAAQQAIDATLKLGFAHSRTAGQGRDEGAALREITGASGPTAKGLAGVDAAQQGVALSAHNQHAAHVKVLADLAHLADRTLTLRGADRDLAAAQDALTVSIRDNGRTLSNNTSKGRANAAALDDVASKTLASLKAHRDSGEPLRQYAQRVDATRAALEREAVKAGMSRAAARKYTDAILAIPEHQTINYRSPGLNSARKGAQNLAADLAKIQGKTVNFHLNADGSWTQGNRKAMAAGGPVFGGTRGRDSVPALLMPDEHVWTAGETAAVGGHSAMMRLRKAAAAGQLRGMAEGGAVERLLYASRFPRPGVVYGNELAAAQAWLKANGGGAGGPIPGGSGVARWGPMVARMLATVGLAASLKDNFLRQIATESGGNPNAVQGNIGDVNNRSGDLAKGLLQVIGATFRAYHWPGTSWNVFDPWANMTASGNYVKHRYPHPEAVIGHGHGYDRGGMLRPGLTLAYNGTGRDERVLTAGQTAMLDRVLSPVARGGGGVTVHLTVSAPNYVGSKSEIDAHVARGLQAGQLNNALRNAVKAMR